MVREDAVAVTSAVVVVAAPTDVEKAKAQVQGEDKVVGTREETEGGEVVATTGVFK